MGKLKIVGKASKEFEYDIAVIELTFQVIKKTSPAALKTVMDQCEEFLSSMDNLHFDVSTFRIEVDKVDQCYDRDEGKIDVRASRTIKMKIPLEMEKINFLLKLIQDSEYDVDVDVDYEFSDRVKIHNDLIKMAIADSKQKAEFIAGVMEQKLTRIDSVEIDDSYRTRIYERKMSKSVEVGSTPEYQYSNKLGRPVSQESEEVEVVWLME